MTASRIAFKTITLALVCGSMFALFSAMTTAAHANERPILLIDVKGAIGVGTYQQIEEAIAAAQSKQAELLVVRLDTPGGLVAATREIISEILNSPVPVAIYVAPAGARAASAGTYISYAAHLSGMAPGTHLGAATPIPLGAPGLPGAPGRDAPDNKKEEQPAASPSTAIQNKVMNDAIAYIRSLAELRGRNVDWAEKAVRDAATLTASAAVKENVVDVLAQDIGELLRQFNGRTVTTTTGLRVLETAGASVVVFEPSWKSKVLTVITDPNIAFILLMIGVYGILFEFWSPGLTGPGVVGAISLLVALTALSAMPVTAAGIALLLLGIALMVGETFAPGVGILGVGGVVAFIAGGFFLFDPAGADIDFSVAWPVLLAVAATTSLLLIGVLGMIMRSREQPVVTGAEELIGSEAKVLSWKGTYGRVRVHGETWTAVSQKPTEPGNKVRVIGRTGMTLEVVPVDERSA